VKWKPKSYGHGDTRIRQGFLFFPKTVAGETRWLVWAKWEEIFEYTNPTFGWDCREIRWID
jgi:hypothetical protein